MYDVQASEEWKKFIHKHTQKYARVRMAPSAANNGNGK